MRRSLLCPVSDAARQVRLLLGVCPVGDRVTRAGIEARKLGFNLWQLRRAKGKA